MSRPKGIYVQVASKVERTNNALDLWCDGKTMPEVAAAIGGTKKSVMGILERARKRGDVRAVRRWFRRPKDAPEYIRVRRPCVVCGKRLGTKLGFRPRSEGSVHWRCRETQKNPGGEAGWGEVLI